jgi:hypothetical protein
MRNLLIAAVAVLVLSACVTSAQAEVAINTIFLDVTGTSISKVALEARAVSPDGVWHDGVAPVTSMALYAGNWNAFGMYADNAGATPGSGSYDARITDFTTSDGYQSVDDGGVVGDQSKTIDGIFSTTTYDYTVPPEPNPDGDYSFGLLIATSTSAVGAGLDDTVFGTAQKWRSQDALNTGGGDQMLAVKLTAAETAAANANVDAGVTWVDPYMLFFEDIKLSASDSDYNDLVLIIDVWSPGVDDRAPPVPEPAALAIWSIFGAGGAALAASRRRRQARWSDANRKAIHDVVDHHSV